MLSLILKASSNIPKDCKNPTCPSIVSSLTPCINSSSLSPIPCSTITALPKQAKSLTLVAFMLSTLSQTPVSIIATKSIINPGFTPVPSIAILFSFAILSISSDNSGSSALG